MSEASFVAVMMSWVVASMWAIEGARLALAMAVLGVLFTAAVFAVNA